MVTDAAVGENYHIRSANPCLLMTTLFILSSSKYISRHHLCVNHHTTNGRGFIDFDCSDYRRLVGEGVQRCKCKVSLLVIHSSGLRKSMMHDNPMIVCCTVNISYKGHFSGLLFVSYKLWFHFYVHIPTKFLLLLYKILLNLGLPKSDSYFLHISHSQSGADRPETPYVQSRSKLKFSSDVRLRQVAHGTSPCYEQLRPVVARHTLLPSHPKHHSQ